MDFRCVSEARKYSLQMHLTTGYDFEDANTREKRQNIIKEFQWLSQHSEKLNTTPNCPSIRLLLFTLSPTHYTYCSIFRLIVELFFSYTFLGILLRNTLKYRSNTNISISERREAISTTDLTLGCRNIFERAFNASTLHCYFM